MGTHRMVSESLHSHCWSLVIESLAIPDSEQENKIRREKGASSRAR
jgi:hypothetical protein